MHIVRALLYFDVVCHGLPISDNVTALTPGRSFDVMYITFVYEATMITQDKYITRIHKNRM